MAIFSLLSLLLIVCWRNFKQLRYGRGCKFPSSICVCVLGCPTYKKFHRTPKDGVLKVVYTCLEQCLLIKFFDQTFRKSAQAHPKIWPHSSGGRKMEVVKSSWNWNSIMQIDPVDSKNNNYITVGLQTKKFFKRFLLIFWKSRKIQKFTNKTFLFEVLQ